MTSPGSGYAAPRIISSTDGVGFLRTRRGRCKSRYEHLETPCVWDRQPSFRVKVRDRRVRAGGIWCNSCQTQIADCPRCDAAFKRAPEKGIDAAIATDLLSLAWEGVLDVAVLVSGDSDFVPAVERIQEKGLKVVNATWRNHGHELAHAC